MTATGSSRSLAKKKLPSYLLHKPTGQARCRIDGRDHYLGDYGSDQSRIKYGNLIAKLAGGQVIDPIARVKSGSTHTKSGSTASMEVDPGPSVGELCQTFLLHAETHYAKNGVTTAEYDCFKSAIRPLRELYSMLPASDFGPLALKAVRAKMIEGDWCRKYINKSIGRIRKIFRHAVENELIEPSVLQRLEAMSPLLAGRTEAKDYSPRQPVPQSAIDQVKAVVPERTGDLIDLQLLTGARSSELLQLTGNMIDRSGKDVWIAKLVDHKTAHHGKERVLVFGPKAKLILAKYLTLDPTRRLFTISRMTYGKAIVSACEKLDLARWTPHWLRHNAASRLREEYGLDVAQVMLGHSSADMTQLYAHLNLTKTIEAAKACG